MNIDLSLQEKAPTVNALAEFYDFAQCHGLATGGGKVGQDAGAEGDLLVEVTLSETITTELKLRRVCVGEISI